MEFFTANSLKGGAGCVVIIGLIVAAIKQFTPIGGKFLIAFSMGLGELFYWLFIVPKPAHTPAEILLGIINGLIVGLTTTGAHQLVKKAP